MEEVVFQKKVYSVYDSKAEVFKAPFVTVTRAVAIRMFRSAAMDPEHDFYKFGGDFTLFEIGEWDDRTGKVRNLTAFVNLGTALGLSAVKG